MTAEQLIQAASDTAKRLFPDDEKGAAEYEAEMLRRFLREVMAQQAKA